jgi:hypothetical protein
MLLSVLLLSSVASWPLVAQERRFAAPSTQNQAPPEAHQRRSIPEEEDAMAKGQDLLFKKHDPRASIDEFRRAAKLDPSLRPSVSDPRRLH